MTMRVLIFVLFASVLIPCKAENISIDDVDQIHLAYSRAFHEEINITISIHSPDNIQLFVEIIPIHTTADDRYLIAKEKIIGIRAEDISPLINFYNNQKYKELFKSTPKRIILDGSSVSLEFSFNTYTEVFIGQTIFDNPVGSHDIALAKLTRYLINLADIEIDKRDFY